MDIWVLLLIAFLALATAGFAWAAARLGGQR